MSQKNGVGRKDRKPPGAIILTRALLEQTSTKWVRLPLLSLKIERLPVDALIEAGLLTPVESWSDEQRDAARKAIVDARLQAKRAAAPPEVVAVMLDAAEAAITDAELLEAEAATVRAAGVFVQIGTVGLSLLRELIPAIPGTEAWPAEPEARAQAITAWRAALPAEERQRWDGEVAAAPYRILAEALLQPTVSPVEARQFADDVFFLLEEIGRLSGLELVQRAGGSSSNAAPAGVP